MSSEPVIAVTPKLRAYLEKHDARYICVDLAEAKSCGGPVGEVYAYLPKGKRLESAPRKLEGDGITVLLMKRTLRWDDQVTFDLRRFLGIADVRVSGIHL